MRFWPGILFFFSSPKYARKTNKQNQVFFFFSFFFHSLSWNTQLIMMFEPTTTTTTTKTFIVNCQKINKCRWHKQMMMMMIISQVNRRKEKRKEKWKVYLFALKIHFPVKGKNPFPSNKIIPKNWCWLPYYHFSSFSFVNIFIKKTTNLEIEKKRFHTHTQITHP